MFRHLPPALPAAPIVEQALVELAATMIQGEFLEKIAAGEPVDTAFDVSEPEDENAAIPSGYTYLGQFIDHDITFDPVSSLDRFNDPDALQDFRTPRFDLDSIYGSGPDDQPFLYQDDEQHLLLGDDKDFVPARGQRPDLPRNNANPRRALIGDKRNDENTIVSQLHTTFLRFHNKVLDGPASGDFALAQQLVRWHYQWIVLHDFLHTVVGDDTWNAVIGNKSTSEIAASVRYYHAKGRYAFIPVEFSVAAYRFGHSMVRPSYALNRIVMAPTPTAQPFQDKTATFNRIPIFSLLDNASNPLANLNGFRDLPGFWPIDWSFFFNGVTPDGPPPAGAVIPQPSYKIDTILVDPLQSLPDKQKEPEPRRSLAFRNLLRSWRLELPSGQDVARHMCVTPLSDADVYGHEDEARAKARAEVLRKYPFYKGHTPLWFYILREAEVLEEAAHLGPVGGRIVAEVFAGLALEDNQSYLTRDPSWTPILPAATEGDFTMADLINFTNS